MWCASAATCAPSRSLSTASSTVARVAPRAGDDEAVVLGDPERLGVELALDRCGEPAHVLAQQRPAGGDRARVARRVAVALLDLGRRDDDVVDGPRDRLSAAARDQPRLARERLDGLERQRASRPRG